MILRVLEVAVGGGRSVRVLGEEQGEREKERERARNKGEQGIRESKE